MLVRGPHAAASKHGQALTTREPLRRANGVIVARARPSSSTATDDADAAAAATTTLLGRRLSLALLASAPAAAYLAAPAPARATPGDWSSPGLASRPEDEVGPAFTKTPSGASLQVVDPGSRGGDAVSAPELGPDGAVVPGDRVEIDYVLRRFNSYFIYSNVEGVSFQPRDVPTGVVELTMGGACGGVGGADGPGAAPAVIRGLEEALVGLRAGARLRVLVPPGLGYTDGGVGGLGPLPPTFATKRQLLNHAREPLLMEVEVIKVKKRA